MMRVRRCGGRRAARGVTLLELTIALVLLALMAGVLYGALGFAGTASDKGEAKVDASAGMRLAEAFLRAQIETQHPLRLRKVAEFPLLFAGERDELRYAAPLPARVAGGGVWYFRLSVAPDPWAQGDCPLVEGESGSGRPARPWAELRGPGAVGA